MSIKVIDNILDEWDFHKLKVGLLEDRNWSLLELTSAVSQEVFEAGEEDHLFNAMFCKVIVDREGTVNPGCYLQTYPLLAQLKAECVMRMKLNVTMASDINREYGWHKDADNRISNARVGLLYLHDTDGGTLIKKDNGEVVEVESKENRFVSFPLHLEHTGVSSTNNKIRGVLNINYIVADE